MPSDASTTGSAPAAANLVGAPGAAVFDAVQAIAMDRQGRLARMAFAGVFALVSLLVLPWPIAAGWAGAVVAWEVFNLLIVEPLILGMSQRAAHAAYPAFNLIGASIYQSIALLSLATGTPIGIAIGATWLGGAFMNNFIYSAGYPRLLWACLIPGIAAAIVGPALAHGVSVGGAVISGLILASLVAAREFSVDHQVLLKRLGERQSDLVEVERKLSVAVEASGDGLFESDLLAGGSRVSAGWAVMLGYEPDEFERPELLSFVHPEDIPTVQREFAAHFRGETKHTTSEQRMRCKDGSYKWVLARARVVAWTPEGRPWRLIGTTVDISARKALEHQLEAARDIAESANAAKSVFVANMSHEIRTPLNGVVGVAGALARTKLTPAQREMVALVQSSAEVLDRLLTDVLDQSKLEAGDFELQIAPFDLREAIDAAVQLMRPRAHEKGLAFNLAFSPAADGMFEGDGVRLRQIVSNLASNAIKFTEVGEVSIGVAVEEPGPDAAPLSVVITVSDTGIGFDAATAERLFGRFFQADGSISRRFGGTGLGLAICKSLAEVMGGDVAAVSTPGQGSVFTVRLPLARAVAEPHALATGAAGEPEASIAGLRILLAEDHPTNRRVVQLILEPFGVDLTLVEDGAAAVAAFLPGAFDVILMDMQMPVMDGLAATREIRRREREMGWAPTPIAMLTANATADHRSMAAEAGATHHISKPVTPGSLVAGVAAALADADLAEAPARQSA